MVQPEYPTLPESTRQLSNYGLLDIVTPIDPVALRQLLQDTSYDPHETEFLVDGFINGFRLGYHGPRDVQITSCNLKFHVGDKFDLWDKVMTEVAAKRYCGPYDCVQDIPFKNPAWLQAPCGLVPKAPAPDGRPRTRLINHHSFPYGRSANDGIPDEMAKVTYQDFQDAVKLSVKLAKENPNANIHYTKCDGKNAFRVLSLHPDDRFLQVVKAENPLTGKFQFFVDTCISFGSRASCFLYEKLSKALAHIYYVKTGVPGVSYLDDALQIGISEEQADVLLQAYLNICSQINMPMADDKTVYATQIIIFLGMLLNARNGTIGLPQDKINKALNQIDSILGDRNVTILRMQQITGLLNFFGRAIVPGRAFTRRLYAAFSSTHLKQHHHIRVSNEVRLDLSMWRTFLLSGDCVFRPFVDFDDKDNVIDLPCYSDAAKSPVLGYAACFLDHSAKSVQFCFAQWEPEFIQSFDPSVQFLELFALSCGVFLFAGKLSNKKVRIYCDNQAVLSMVNNGTSSCKHCMILIRQITLSCLFQNISLQVSFVPSAENVLADPLSRLNFGRFAREVPAGYSMVQLSTPAQLLPAKKFFDGI